MHLRAFPQVKHLTGMIILRSLSSPPPKNKK